MTQEFNSSLPVANAFRQVPFPDGRMPWGLHSSETSNGAEVVLPALTCKADTLSLDLPLSYACLKGCFPRDAMITGPRALERRQEKIMVAISCAGST
ncbi:hypothetical protein BDN71DRAFT_1281611 [Pleurotus eryngii]|uniref:Mug135-like C-terminal domain-containing protein n=1 Tax=Pleurotus eryngii TaxID=5323 RepID=A0A9P5ZSB3_PLEER|nr:hypothetical protein BDN71DRAFT_1281611 [Pleurotus eryngii]